MDINKYKNKGLSGLVNLGNTCFINSCIQVLSHSYELNIIFENETFKNKLKNKEETKLLLEYYELIKLLWHDNCIISPVRFIKTIHEIATIKDIPIFSGFSQNDVSEFLLFLIDCFHNSLSREVKMSISGNPENNEDHLAIKCFEMIKNMYSQDYSEFWNILYAINISEIYDASNNELIKRICEPFFMIDLPIPPDNKNPSLIDCFNHYTDGELIEDFYNEDKKERLNIIKKIKFWSFPNILIIDLKRFNNNFQKNQINVNFPIDELDLSNFVIGYKKDNYKYELYGICNHSGGVLGGHYTSYVKNANGKWYHFNDTNINEVNSINELNSSKAYVLFYRKKYNLSK
jgi:ubiquitin carboxyl-terminal hydrolase 8